MDWDYSNQFDPLLHDALGQGLDQYNAKLLAFKPDRTPVHISLSRRDGHGLVAGLTGHAKRASAWFHIVFLWVREDHRRQGLGESLLAECTRLAKAEGFKGLELDTLDFQAPDYYPKLGFEVYAEMPEHYAGSTRYYLRKRID